MNKRGTSLVLLLFEMVVVALVIGGLFFMADRFVESEAIPVANLVHDMEMMVNTLVGTPGDVIIAYPHDVSQYTFSLRQESITVVGEDTREEIQRSLLFRLPEGYEAIGFVERAEKVCFEKKSSVKNGKRKVKITLEECGA